MEIKVTVELLKVDFQNDELKNLMEKSGQYLVRWDRVNNGTQVVVYGIRNVGNTRDTIIGAGGEFITEEEFNATKDLYDFY